MKRHKDKRQSPAPAYIGILTPYAVETRYPGFWGEITEKEVDEAVVLAETVLQWASDHITHK